MSHHKHLIVLKVCGGWGWLGEMFTKVPISRTNAFAQEGLMVYFFNPQIKNWVNYLTLVTYCDFPSWSATATYTNLSKPALSALQQMSPSLPLSQGRPIHIYPPHDLGCFRDLPPPMTWLGCPLLGLPRSFCRSMSQTPPLIITLIHITAKTTRQQGSHSWASASSKLTPASAFQHPEF